jgi:hypothetical protein
MADRKSKPETTTVRVIASESEGTRIWRHATIGLDGIIRMLEDYADNNVPGITEHDIDSLTRMKTRVEALVSKITGPVRGN